MAAAVLAASVLGSGLALSAAPHASAGVPNNDRCRFSYATPVLHLGSTGREVEQAQCLLNAAGGALAIDGSFGYATRATVRAFQTREHLTVDGYVGPQTWAALYRYN